MKTLLSTPGLAVTVSVLLYCCSCGKRSFIYPERKDIIETVYASGKVVAEDEYQQYALSSGTIVKKLVKDGDSVRKGQLLFVIRNDAASARLEAAERNYGIIERNLSGRSPVLADLQLAYENSVIKLRNDSITYHRWKNLWDKNVGSKVNLDNVYTTYQVSLNQKKIAEQKYYSARNEIQQSYNNAKSQLKTALDDLKEHYISSSLNGIVYQTFKEEGEAVRSNEVVALVGGHMNHQLRLFVDQQDIDVVAKGQQILLQSDVTGNTIYEAVVTHIYPSMNESDQTFRVDARFTKPPRQQFIHSSIEANIIIQKKSKALVIPRNVMDKDSLWIYENGKEKKIGIQTGITTLEYVEVVKGVNEHTSIIPHRKTGAR